MFQVPSARFQVLNKRPGPTGFNPELGTWNSEPHYLEPGTWNPEQYLTWNPEPHYLEPGTWNVELFPVSTQPFTNRSNSGNRSSKAA